MIPSHALPQTVTVVRPTTTTDRYGNTTTSWSNATRAEYAAWIEQSAAGENTDQRDQQSADWLLIVQPDADVNGRDRVEYDGKTFEVVGPPTRRNTFRGTHHIEATLRWIEG
jgi:head-tail adaptor